MSVKGFLTGILAGAVVGAGASMLMHASPRTAKKISRDTSRLFSTMGCIADDILAMYR